jgi:hypothetical protein
MMKQFKPCLELITKYTPLNKVEASNKLIEVEDNIRYNEIIKNYENFGKEYFISAMANIINKYKR